MQLLTARGGGAPAAVQLQMADTEGTGVERRQSGIGTWVMRVVRVCVNLTTVIGLHESQTLKVREIRSTEKWIGNPAMLCSHGLPLGRELWANCHHESTQIFL